MTKLNENLQRVNDRVDKYLKGPSAKQIHDVRTAIRRLDAAFSMLPKKYRKGSSLSDYVLKCKELFKVNSEIRDFDIIYEKLEKYPSSVQKDKVIEVLKRTKDARLEHAKTIALSLKSTDISKIVDRRTEKELQKRYGKILLRLISKMESAFPIVLVNYSAIEELHDLRIACKKLRYMLELLPDENKSALQTRRTLQRLQDILGAIHDYDFTTGYLKSLGHPSKEIQEIINIENEERKLKFEEFLKYCKRRLRISPDSFLIRIRSFQSPV